eukprot:354135-Chlamydomonas_euryale.AAC.2
MDGWMDERTDSSTVGRTDGWKERCENGLMDAAGVVLSLGTSFTQGQRSLWYMAECTAVPSGAARLSRQKEHSCPVKSCAHVPSGVVNLSRREL